VCRAAQEFTPTKDTWALRILETDDLPQLWTCRRTKTAGRRACQLWANLSKKFEVIRRFEVVRQKEGGDVGLIEDIGGFLCAIGRIDIHQDRADRCRGELQDDPLRPVRRPDADVIAVLNAERDQGAGAFVHVI